MEIYTDYWEPYCIQWACVYLGQSIQEWNKWNLWKTAFKKLRSLSRPALQIFERLSSTNFTWSILLNTLTHLILHLYLCNFEDCLILGWRKVKDNKQFHFERTYLQWTITNPVIKNLVSAMKSEKWSFRNIWSWNIAVEWTFFGRGEQHWQEVASISQSIHKYN